MIAVVCSAVVKEGRVVSLLLLLLFPGMAGICEGRPLVIVGTEWPPYDMNLDGQPSGLGIEIMTAVFDKMGIEYESIRLPWKRAVSYVRTGRADAIIEVSMNAGRKAFLYYPDTPIHNSRYVFFVKKGNEHRLLVESYADLGKYQVGVTSGYSYTEGLWAVLKDKENYIENNEDQQSLRMLVMSRIDLFPCDLATGMYLAKRLGISDKVAYLPYVFSEKDYYLGFSRKSDYPHMEQVVKEYGAELKRFKETAEYQRIVASYPVMSKPAAAVGK